MLAKVKNGCTAWFGCLYPHSFLDTKGVLAMLGGVDSTKISSTDPSHWELICSDFSDGFKNPSTSPEIAIKHEIDCLTLYHLLRGSADCNLWSFEVRK